MLNPKNTDAVLGAVRHQLENTRVSALTKGESVFREVLYVIKKAILFLVSLVARYIDYFRRVNKLHMLDTLIQHAFTAVLAFLFGVLYATIVLS